MWFGLKKQPQTPAPAVAEHRHKSAHPQGGFNLSLGDNSNTQAITASIFKQLGGKIMTGNFSALTNFSKPIAMSVEMSFLNQIANGHIYCGLLEKAADLEPVEQLKFISAYLVAGLHANGQLVKLKSPLDPQVGETLQVTKLAEGISFYAEQLSFDPPRCRYQIKGKKFTIQGVDAMEIQVHKTVNSLSGKQNGWMELTFENGSNYRISFPQMEITGLVMGDRVMNFSGQQIIKGPGVKAIINFNYNAEGMMKKLTSYFSSEQAKIHDIIEVDILDENEAVVSQGIGSWLEDLRFGDQCYWKITEEVEPWKGEGCVLDSDSSRRPDLVLMLENKMDDAQKQLDSEIRAKLELEELYSKDAQNRRQQRSQAKVATPSEQQQIDQQQPSQEEAQEPVKQGES